MKLIHCADLHLDSPMGTHMTMQQASARNTQITDSFLQLTEFARENGVRAVIIAGDLFDGTRVRSRTVDEILAAMERTPEVDYLYLPGNHDGAARAFSDRVLPENLKQFPFVTKTRQSPVCSSARTMGKPFMKTFPMFRAASILRCSMARQAPSAGRIG